MDKKTADTIMECKILLNEMANDIQELKNNTVTKEAFNNLDARLKKQEEGISKITWAIIMAVLGALLSLVIKGF